MKTTIETTEVELRGLLAFAHNEPASRLTGRVSDDCKLVGNAVCPPVMRAIVEQISKRG